MVAELDIEALLADEEPADQVWDLWHAGLITDDMAARPWSTIGVGTTQAIDGNANTGEARRGLDALKHRRFVLRSYY